MSHRKAVIYGRSPSENFFTIGSENENIFISKSYLPLSDIDIRDISIAVLVA